MSACRDLRSACGHHFSELVERRGSFDQQARPPGFDALVLFRVEGRGARLRAERRFDRRGVDVAHELADVLPLARQTAAAGDALREQDGVEQLLGAGSSATQVGFLERDEPCRPDPAPRRPRACARSCSGAPRIPDFPRLPASYNSAMQSPVQSKQLSRARKSTAPGFPELKNIVSDTLAARAPAGSDARPRRTSACRRD